MGHEKQGEEVNFSPLGVKSIQRKKKALRIFLACLSKERFVEKQNFLGSKTEREGK